MTERAILVRAIVTRADHDWAIRRITELTDANPAPGTAKDHELEALITLVDRYEELRFPMGTPEPASFIAFMMEQKGLTRKDLEPMIGSRARVSEVLSGKRNLTLNMIRRLHRELHIPAEYLIGVAPKPAKKPKVDRPGAKSKAAVRVRKAA